MSVYRTPRSPYWQYDFQTQGRRFHGSTGAETRRAAEQFERRLRAEVAGGGRPKRLALTLNEAAERYYQEVAQHHATAREAEAWLAAIVEGIGPSLRLNEIGDTEVADYVARRRAHLKNASMLRELDVLRSLLRRAGRVWKEPVQDIAWAEHRPPAPEVRVRELRDDEDEKLFDALHARHPALTAALAFMATSGLRFANVRTLTWSMVDLSAGLLTVMVKDRQKAGGRRASVPITPRLRAQIMARREEHPIYVFTYECEKTLPRQGRIKGERYPFSRSGWRKVWRAACADAKLIDFQPHDLRHTFATRLLRQTGNLKLTKEALHHASITSTMRYAHTLVDDRRVAMEAVEQPRNSPGLKLVAGDKVLTKKGK